MSDVRVTIRLQWDTTIDGVEVHVPVEWLCDVDADELEQKVILPAWRDAVNKLAEHSVRRLAQFNEAKESPGERKRRMQFENRALQRELEGFTRAAGMRGKGASGNG